MWGMEVGNATPTLNDLVNNVIRLKYQGKEENWITAGPSQFIGQHKTSEKEPPGLEYYLKEICERIYGNISEENNNRIIAATHGLKTSDEMAEPHIKWIQALFKEAGLEILISSSIKVWCT